jgi:hypothetical protein
MISTKLLISDIRDVPQTWIFEYYCKLTEKLTGQELKIKSLFNPAEKVPSFSIYVTATGKYKYKDFSTGIGPGDGVHLIQELEKLDVGNAIKKIVEDYNSFILKNGCCYTMSEFKEHTKYKITTIVKRKWNVLDKNFWMQYGIGSKMLEHYNVAPLDNYILEKVEEGEQKILTIKGYFIYGYFRADGTLYKVYQPKVRDRKFLKVQSYIQGTDQLEVKSPYLVICSSLKDLMCLETFDWNLETVAPDSENTLIPKNVIKAYQDKFSQVVTLFDIDDPGKKAMLKYKEQYGIQSIELNLEKDLSDSVAKYGQEKVKEILKPLLRTALNIKTKKEIDAISVGD